MIIYKITNLINNKIYIGQTQQLLKKRWARHKSNSRYIGCSAISDAIRKYGKENFIIEQIDFTSKLEELTIKEIYWMKHYNSLAPNGYNLIEEGVSRKVTEKTKIKMRNSYKRARRKYLHPLKGKTGIGRSIKVKCNETNEIFESARQASIKLWGHPNLRTRILDVCKGKKSRNTVKGLKFCFIP